MNLVTKPAYLVLQNGTVFKGKSMGKEGKAIGEVVFSTSMVGYQEALTNPANYGNLFAQTFPLIGNYGINSFCNESDTAYLSGYIVREICDLPSNFRCEKPLNDFLIEKNVVGICDIDTRRLTKIIREEGAMNGIITTQEVGDINDIVAELKAFKVTDAVRHVSSKETKKYKAEQAKYNLAVLDFGVSQSVIDAMMAFGCDVTVLPFDTTAQQVKALNPNGILLSDGPCDPSDNIQLIKNVKEIMELKIPTLGISLGHQLMAIANGAKCTKLLYGHRGANQPVVDIESGRTYITSQNHGYIVDDKTIDKNVCEVSFKNGNDKTCEGINYKDLPAFSVQFFPDTKDSMVSTSYVYHKLLDLMK